MSGDARLQICVSRWSDTHITQGTDNDEYEGDTERYDRVMSQDISLDFADKVNRHDSGDFLKREKEV